MSTVKINFELTLKRINGRPALGFFVAEVLRSMANDMDLLKGESEAQGIPVTYQAHYAGHDMLVDVVPTYEVTP